MLTLHGIKCPGKKDWKTYLVTVKDWKSDLLGDYQKEELLREVKRLELVEAQLKPDSELSKWFNQRFNGSKRMRKIGIIALARKLLIALVGSRAGVVEVQA